jgi:hypothetical protein
MKSRYAAARVQSGLGAVFTAEAFVADARKLSLQWHIWVDGDSVISAVYAKGGWHQGPPLAVQDTHSAGTILSGVDQLVRRYKSPRIGLVFHVADECASAHIQERFASPEAWEATRRTIIDSPAEVIDERVPAGAAFRLVPFPGTKKAGGIRLSSREQVFEALAGDRRVTLCVSSAPLELLSVSVPLFKPDEVRDGALALLVYARFTVLATIHEQTRELCGLAVLPHSNKGVPTGIATRLATEMKSAGLGRANVYLLEAGGDVHRAIEAVISDIQTLCDQQRSFVDSIALHGVARLDPKVFGAEGQDTMFVRYQAESANVPPSDLFRPEFLCGNGQLAGVVSADVGGVNFSAAALKASASAITRTEAILFQVTRALRVACIVGLVGSALAFGTHVVGVTQAAFWNLDPKIISAAEARLQRLGAINTAISWWDKMLAPRSSSWANMEFLAQLFPEKTPAVVNSLNYEFLPQQVVRKPGADQPPPGIGYIHRWTIKGVSTGGSVTKTNVEDALERLAELTGYRLYTKSATQRLNVAATSERQSNPVTIRGKAYDSMFSITIELEVLPADPMAFPVGKVVIPAPDQIVAQ